MLEEFRKAVENRIEVIKENKKPGQKAVGWMCSYVPEEIFHAAGIYPVRVFGTKQGTSMADSYLHIDMCSLVRACLEEALRGNYDVLDGFVTLNSCDNIRRLYDIWSSYLKDRTPFTQLLSLPHKVTEASVAYFRDELARLKTALEQWSGSEISDQALRESIAVYNKMRRLLRQLDDLRKAEPPRISSAEMWKVVLSAQTLPKEKFNRLLEQFLKELKGREPLPTDSKVRVILVGSELDDPDLLQLIEESGIAIVGDDVCTGSKYYWNQTELSGDPLMALAQRYLNRPDCPRMRPSAKRVQHIRDLVTRRKAAGVILEVIKFCKLHDEGAIAVCRALAEDKVANITISREYTLTGAGGLRTRVEAFRDLVQGI